MEKGSQAPHSCPERPRHRGTRGVEYLVVGKLSDESESFAWWMAAVEFRAWPEDGSILEDTESLAKVAGLSPRSARRCRREAMGKGIVSPGSGRSTSRRSD